MKKPKRSGMGASAARLLDTCTLLWALGSPESLSARARRLVASGANVISVVSYWEVVIKAQKGLLEIHDLAAWWRRATELMAARVLPIQARHITGLASLPSPHRDPFDRLLVAQAIVEGLEIISNDKAFEAYPVRLVW